MNNAAFVSFLVLTISISHVGVSGQYIQYNAKANRNAIAKDGQSATDKHVDTATHSEYEYYDDLIEDLSTTQIPTTTTTTTTPKPITSYRVLTTHRNGFRPLNFNKKKFDTTTRQYQPDSYTEASNDSAFVQKHIPPKQPLSPPQLRNAIEDINRRATGKDYAQEKLSAIDPSNGNANYFSKRYARFLFKLRSG